MLHILERLFPKPRVEPRWHAATKEENRAARQLRADRRMELEIMSIHLTPEQRAAARNRALSMVFPPVPATQRLMRMQGKAS